MPPRPVDKDSEERVTARGDARSLLEGFEVGRERASVGVATLWVGVEGLVDDDRQVLVDAGLAEEAVAVAEVGGRDLLKGAELPEHGADGEDVGALVDGLAALLFRGHVGRGAEDGAGGGEVVAGWGLGGGAGGRGLVGGGGEVFGQAPVDDDRLAEGADDDIGGLEVAVDDVAAVGVGDGVGDGDDVVEETDALLEGVALGDELAQRAAGDQLHRVVRSAVGPAPGLVDRDDAWVLEARGDEDLAQKADFVAGAARVELFDGDVAAELAIECARHLAQPAAGGLPQVLVAARAAKLIWKAGEWEAVGAGVAGRARNLVGSHTARR